MFTNDGYGSIDGAVEDPLSQASNIALRSARSLLELIKVSAPNEDIDFESYKIAIEEALKTPHYYFDLIFVISEMLQVAQIWEVMIPGELQEELKKLMEYQTSRSMLAETIKVHNSEI